MQSYIFFGKLTFSLVINFSLLITIFLLLKVARHTLPPCKCAHVHVQSDLSPVMFGVCLFVVFVS